MPQVNISLNNLTFDDLTDVSINIPVSGDFVYYNGSEWNNISLDLVESSGGLVPQSVVFVDTDGKLIGDYDHFRYSGQSLRVNHITAPGSGDAYHNECFGLGAGVILTNGGSNTLVGYNAGNTLTGSQSNTLIGTNAGRLLSGVEGSYNVALGSASLYVGTTAAYNTIIGQSAGYSLIDGTENVFVGRGAGFWSISGGKNTYVGTGAGVGGTSQSSNENTCIGYHAGYDYHTEAIQNVVIGAEAGTADWYVKRSILIGYNVEADNYSADSCFNIGNHLKGYHADASDTAWGNVGQQLSIAVVP